MKNKKLEITYLGDNILLVEKGNENIHLTVKECFRIVDSIKLNTKYKLMEMENEETN